MTESKILIFGPQALSFDASSLKSLRTRLYSDPSNNWVLDVLSTLPKTLAQLAAIISKPQLVELQQQLESLMKTIQSGEISAEVFPLSNTLLSPLVVVSQLTDYVAFIKAVEPALAEEAPLHISIIENTETLGLCIGILSAFATASARTIGELQRYGAVAVRLAMLSGAWVDLEDASRDPESESTSFSVSCAAASLADLEAVLQQFSGSYISVRMDERRATVTCQRSNVVEVQQALKESGMHVSAIALKGRFHWSGHQQNISDLIRFVNKDPTLQLIESSETVMPTRANNGGQYLGDGRLHDIALRAILTDQSLWHKTMDLVYTGQLQSTESKVLCFGTERCLPPTIARKLDSRLIHVADNDVATYASIGITPKLSDGPDDRIAIIGMSCQVANGEDLEGFWQVLMSGESQHREVPAERFKMNSVVREIDPKTKWYGNFIREVEVFDHKFFKKSPREMGSTDPQHRVALQLAYQAVQQSGYYGVPDFDKHIGVYVGHANTDYEHNIRGYPANAYSATGNLKSLLAGKISHYFGWTGPSLTLDTACSSSSVAIHLACRAILNGEITGALAGGVNLLTSPEWYYNLAGASFLSPTGQCKSFDAKGDGYCRGEGSGLVFLKKMSAAIADGDQILGVIAGTSVLQNQNCTPITVPNSLSLADLFRGVVKRARVQPHDISVVEAHGTGTAVGDPAEYDGIRQVFGGPTRPDRLFLTAVKGSIGHLEVASGVASLIKVLLMIHEGAVPPQASFNTINPNLKAKSEDKIDITTISKPWIAPIRTALINNYGASGSNASMVVMEAPEQTQQSPVESTQLAGRSFPFWIGGFDDNSLKRYAIKLKLFLQRKVTSGKTPSLANLSFQVARQSNRTLAQALVFGASSVQDLEGKLFAFEKGTGVLSLKVPAQRPVIMCFGGQISTFVGLDKDMFDSVTVLRQRLDECNAICLALGLDSIYPDIFQRSPLRDIVKLQVVLFATQYSCAMAWIDCGVQVSAIVGHSFGELTGLCVSGALSLRESIQMIAKRAKIIQESPATEKGSMMAIGGDLIAVENLVAEARRSSESDVAIACYNTPKSYTIAGSTTAIKAVEEMVKKNPKFSTIQVKILDVTNAFHSSLMDPIRAELVLLGQSLMFRKPKIRLERATERAELGHFGKDYVSQHLRGPVYFQHAVERLSKEYHDAIWLEAGSNSTITNMASKALANSSSSFFQPINITTEASYSILVDATTKLWQQGLNVTFWAHHKSQVSDYTPLLLPPYQFEKSKHWLEIKEPLVLKETTTAPTPVTEPEKGLSTFFGFIDESKRSVRFRINTNTPEFKKMNEAHVMASTVAVMPGMLPVEIVIDAVSSMRPEFQNFSYQPELEDMVYYCPLVPEHCSAVWLDAQPVDAMGLTWEWKITGQDIKGASTRYISGLLIYSLPQNPAVKNEFARLSRLGSYKRGKRLLDGDADDVVVGRNIYRAFESVIDYKDVFRHLSKLVGKDGDSAGRVVRAHKKDGWLDSVLTDCFCQVGGIAVNLFSDTADFAQRGIYIGDRIDRWVRAPGLLSDPAKPKEWEVFCMNHRESDTAFISDVFAFDARDGSLYEAVLGIRYSKVPLALIRKALSRVVAENPLQAGAVPALGLPHKAPQMPSFAALPTLAPATLQQQEAPLVLQAATNGFSAVNGTQATPKATQAKASGLHIPAKTKDILSNLSGVEVEDIKDDSDLVEMGIDSLMAMELIREVDAAFKVTLETDQLMDLTDFRSLVVCISTTMGLDVNGAVDGGAASATFGTSGVNGVNGHDLNGHKNGVNGHGANGHSRGSDGLDGAGAGRVAKFPSSTVLEVVRATKAVTDEFIVKHNMANYYSQVRPVSTLLCAAYIVEAFEKLGCSFRDVQPGERLKTVSFLPKHQKFMKELYKIIGPEETGLVEFADSNLVRTSVPCPDRPASMLLEEALRAFPDHAPEFKLSALTGCKLAECLVGKADGLQIIFGSAEGRKTVSDVYAVAPVNFTWIDQAAFFMEQLLRRLPAKDQQINILEIGAGTGGTTATLIPMLAALGLPLTYTFTDLSSSLVAAARKRFKEYPFMEFKVANMESAPDRTLLNSQHIIIANACVHATRSLPISLRNIRNMLRSDGLLMLLEETEQLPWVDFVFGLLEGWWLFEDGRTHAQVSAEHWEKVLRGAGFGHVDYTDGERREAQVQRVIFGFASDIRYAADPDKPPYPVTLRHEELTSLIDRQAIIDGFVGKYTSNFHPPESSKSSIPSLSFSHSLPPSEQLCVLVTGATGSLGSHVVSTVVKMPTVSKVICLNRLGSVEAVTRQREAFMMRGIEVAASFESKLQILATEPSKPMLGLSADIYGSLVNSVTHIVHSAWPMSLTRTTKAYEVQFQVMRNLIDLARECAGTRPSSFQLSFQFISSIGAVGYYPLWTGRSLAPELPTTADTALPVGYADAKIVCEHILEETLRLYPNRFRAMAVRIAQITGSRSNGYWNPIEHFSFFVKSAQFLRSIPDLHGTLSWSPVDDVAASLLDILMSQAAPYSIYHIENPVRQPWSEMVSLLAEELDIPSDNIVPYEQWVERIRSCDASMTENPAKQLMEFWDTHYLRMSTGPLVLDTKHSREHSRTMREGGPIEAELVKRYIQRWKLSGFLKGT